MKAVRLAWLLAAGALFAEHDFAAHNPVSRAMQAMVDTLGGAGLEAETAKLEGFYASVRRRAAEVSSAQGKQQVIAELYEKFFKVGFAKQAEAAARDAGAGRVGAISSRPAATARLGRRPASRSASGWGRAGARAGRSRARARRSGRRRSGAGP